MKSTARKQRRVEQTRLEILEAAARAFARSGIDGTTMQDIARESGYTPASLYAYFPGKQAILEGLLGLLRDELLATFDVPTPAGLTFGQSLELLCRRQLELADRRRDALSVFIACGGGARQFIPREQTGFQLYVPTLAAWLRRAARAGDLRVPAEEAAVLFAGLMHGFFHRWIRGEERTTMA